MAITVSIPTNLITGSQGDVVVYIPRAAITNGTTQFTVRPSRKPAPTSR